MKIKKLAILLLILLLGTQFAAAEQITKIAVVDLELIFKQFFTESKAVKDILQKEEKLKKDIENIDKEINDLNQKKLEAMSDDNDSKALSLQEQINKKKAYKTEYIRVKQEEINMAKKNLYNSNDFFKDLLDTIRYVSESKGYSIVIQKNNNSFLLWYTPEIDITQEVILRLKSIK